MSGYETHILVFDVIRILTYHCRWTFLHLLFPLRFKYMRFIHYTLHFFVFCFLCPSNFFGLPGSGYKYEKERGNKREKTLGGGRKNKGSSLPLPCGWICLVCQWRVIFSCISYFNRLLSGVKITNENEAFKVSLYFVCTLIQLLRWSCAAAIQMQQWPISH